MKFEDFIKKGLVKKTSKDLQLIKSIIKCTNNDLKFLSNLEINEISARKIFSNYYDTLRSVLEAKALVEGFKIYSHEAFTYFLKKENENIFAEKFDRLRKIRNRINYYGNDISIEEVKEYKEEIITLIKKIKLDLE
jgi:hypothetical protein